MKKYVIFILIFSIAFIFPSISEAGDNKAFFDVVVKFKTSNPDWGYLYSNDLVIKHEPAFEFSDNLESRNIYRLTLESSDTVDDLRQMPFVEWLDADKKISVAADANDEFFTSSDSDVNAQWYLPRIKAPDAWSVRKQASNLTIAIIDTGIDALHQDLNDGRVVAGQKVYCENIVDNRCTERVRGDIPEGVNSDDNSHGTSVASVAGAITNNSSGVSGVAWKVKLMPIKVLNKDGVGTASDVAEGIVWAAQNGADIINLSLGGANLEDSSIVDVATKLAFNEGAVVVSAAGNDKSKGVDLDVNPSNPVCSDGDNNYVLGVAATDYNDILTSFSNYGSECIDISAPGIRILTAYFDPEEPDLKNIYAYRSGTSFAAPMVSATAALIKSEYPEATVSEIQDRIKEMAEDISSLNTTSCAGTECGEKLGAGRLNVYAALTGEVSSGNDQNTDEDDTSEGDSESDGTTEVILIPEGTILKDPNSNKVYIIDSGKKRPLASFVIEQRDIDINSPEELTVDQFGSIPLGDPLPPVEDTLIRAKDSFAVFLIEDEVKKPLTYLSFVTNGFDFRDIEVLDVDFVDSITTGDFYPPKEGVLIKSKDDLTVYLMKAGEKRPLTYLSFVSHGFKFADVVSIDKDQLDVVPTGTVLPPAEDTLVRASDSFTVYVVEANVMHALNYQAFVNRSFSFSDVHVISPEEAELYPVGDPYLE